MALGRNRAVLRQLRTLFNVGAIRELTDGQLLERFATGRGEPAELAFAALIERHGPMVHRVCRAVLCDPHDADDAFQATFLILVKKARGLWVRESLGPWLHQVAYRTASCARTAAARRRRHERRAALATLEARAEAGDELGRALHEEIDRLPGRYRAAVVLCDLEGRTQEQAARHLGWPVGTVKSRLRRGRDRLRDRLLRRGLAPHAGLLAAVPGAEALIPPALVDSTTRAVLQFVTVRTFIKGSAALLAQEVLRSMFLTRWLKVASVLLALGAATTGVGFVAQQGKPAVEPPPEGKAQAARAGEASVAAVQPGKLRVTVVERGSVESSRNEGVFCQVEGGTSIISILPEGTQVKEGQLVCQLDSSRLNDQLVNQRITTQGAEAAYQNAQLVRELAELAVREYVEGILRQERVNLKSAISMAQSAIQKTNARLERTRRAQKRLNDALAPQGGAKTPADIVAELSIADRLDAAEEILMREKMALELAEAKQELLEKYTRDKTIRELKTEVEKARSDELFRQATWELEKLKEAKLAKQIENCQLIAPNDGLVVYANAPNRFAGPSVIEEGAAVRQRQVIFSLPDIGGPMQVNVKIRESRVSEIKGGLRARIHLDAFPNQVFTGMVRTIAPLPDPLSRSNSKTNAYTTLVTIDKVPAGINPRSLRPGMTAQVEILVNELDDVLSVPVGAVLHYDGKDHVAVKKPGGKLDWREVTLGERNDKAVEVKQGLQAGDDVALDPRALLSEEERRTKLGVPAQPPSGPNSP